ncbi:MAG: hypothetical protein U0T81_00315 [Saprospiraceae bacterium]
MLRQEQLRCRDQTRKDKRLPVEVFGYGNTSIQGTGADNRTYQLSDRFHFFQAGLELLQQRSSIEWTLERSMK